MLQKNRAYVLFAAGVSMSLLVAACGSGGSNNSSREALDGTDLDALIEAAQEEGELTAYWHSGRIESVGEAFEEKYGIKVNGSKMSDSEQYEKISGEVSSGNVQADVVGYDDGASLVTQMLPEEWVVNYIPPDLADELSADSKDPLVYLWQVLTWGYNDEVYGDTCPIDNIWELTEPEWNGKVAMLDPDQRSIMYQMFAQMVEEPEALESAYEDHYGESISTEEENAGWEFIKRLAKNDPILESEDTAVSEAVGAGSQTNPPVGMYYLTRHRDAKETGQNLAACLSMEPYVGVDAPTYAAVLNDAPHPNAARLFIHFILTEEGVSPYTEDVGGYSSNMNVPAQADNPYPDREGWGNSLIVPKPDVYAEKRQDLSDFWAINHK